MALMLLMGMNCDRLKIGCHFLTTNKILHQSDRDKVLRNCQKYKHLPMNRAIALTHGKKYLGAQKIS
jgi:hypothetical protein